MFALEDSRLQTQYDLSDTAVRQCSYCAYNFMDHIEELINLIDFKNRKLTDRFVDRYNQLMIGASNAKRNSPYLEIMETFNSDHSQNCYNRYPEIVHTIFNEDELESYEPMHDMYRSQFPNWQDVHNQKLNTPQIDTTELRSVLRQLSDKNSEMQFLIVNRFFMTFQIVPINKHINNRYMNDNVSIGRNNFMILDSHYKKVLFMDTEYVIKYIDSSPDYNLVLIGKVY